jgi:hypothetical protein
MERFKYFFRVLHDASSSWLKFCHALQLHPVYLELVPNLVTREMNVRRRPNVREGVVRLRLLPVLIKLLPIISRS